jgi:hypothetical protein
MVEVQAWDSRLQKSVADQLALARSTVRSPFELCPTDTLSSPGRGRRDGGGATDAPPLCFGATSRFKGPPTAMRAQITLKAATSSTGTVWSKSKGPASTSRCDHCREELRLGAHQYWHMQFCSAACMTAYQQRLAPETRVKICGLDVLPPEDQPSGCNPLLPARFTAGAAGFLILSQYGERPER